MTSMKRLAGGVALTTLLCAMSGAVYAQETTGAIRGLVSDESGAAVPNATVTVTHVPTGASSTTLTGPEGGFSARGLRVGGPYRIRAIAPGFDAGGVTVQAIGVGDAAQVEVVVSRAGGDTEVAELVVTAAAAAPSQGGPGTNFTTADIESLPSISRDIKDVARLDPFAVIDPTNQDALSFAGVNNRFNQLTVDGVRQNDDFGLNNNGYPTQRSPISLDAVEAVNVSVAPYSVINNGFIGGQINAVTKSGGNRFFGTAYYERTGRDWQGDTVEGQPFGADFEEKIWGATLGGPILRDKLFFFAAYEKYEGELGFDEGPFDLGRTVQIPRISSQAVETFRQATEQLYGYDPGSFVTGPFPVEDEKWLAKLDWNITDNHRLALTYQNTIGNSLNGSTSDVFSIGSSVTQPRIGLESQQYNKIEELTTYTAQLNSDWTDSFSTELRYSFKETDTQQNPLLGLEVGEVTVGVHDLPGVAGSGTGPQIRFGADISRHDNYLHVEVETWEAIGRYSWGPHDLLFGARTEANDIFNVFVSNSLGSWTFDSYADFLARRASRFTLTGAVDPNGGRVPAGLGTARRGAADFAFRLNSVYAEDRLQVLDNLDVTAGVRFDWYQMDDVPELNTAFVSRNAFSNQQNLDGKHVMLPRVAVNWEPIERLNLRAGLGRFSSTGLNVWLSNPFANTGVIQTNAACPSGPYTNVDLTAAPAGCTFTPRGGNTNVLDPAFQIPTVWKGSLGAAYEFDFGRWGDGWLVQLDYLKSVNENALYWVDLRAVQTGVAPDGRPIYERKTIGETAGVDFDMMLTGADKGGSDSVALTLAKSWNEGVWDGLGAQFVYTYTEAEDANPMTSSIAQSSYTRFASSDHQRPPAATSDYEIRHRYALNINYARKFFGDYETRVNLFAQHRSGLPFSYTFANSRTGSFDNDFGNNVSSYSGRQATSNQLLYVPAVNDPIVLYAPGFDVAGFNQFLDNSGLSKFRGRIAPRNAFRHADATTIDVRISQELPAFFPNGAKLEVFADIENLGNLLNDDWGVLEQYDFYRGVPVVDVRCATSAAGPTIGCGTPGAKYVYSPAGGGDFQQPVQAFRRNGSTWQIKLGAKYKF